MKHSGKARRAGLKLIIGSLVFALFLIALSALLGGGARNPAVFVVGSVWALLLLFTVSFFRDPDPAASFEAEAFVAPAHGTVDFIDETVEQQFMGGPCWRISIFLSVFDVHVQNAPVGGRVALLKHCPGRFVNAMRSDCGEYNENVFVGIESAERSGERVAVRLIAGLIARRIVPWIREDEVLSKGERIGLIQFGSRVDLFLPLSAKVRVKVRDKVKGGETVIATRG